jgi:hypothetical protein
MKRYWHIPSRLIATDEGTAASCGGASVRFEPSFVLGRRGSSFRIEWVLTNLRRLRHGGWGEEAATLEAEVVADLHSCYVRSAARF